MELVARFHHSVGHSEQLVVKRDLDAAIKVILGKVAVGRAALGGQGAQSALVEMSSVPKPAKLFAGLSPVPSLLLPKGADPGADVLDDGLVSYTVQENVKQLVLNTPEARVQWCRVVCILLLLPISVGFPCLFLVLFRLLLVQQTLLLQLLWRRLPLLCPMSRLRMCVLLLVRTLLCLDWFLSPVVPRRMNSLFSSSVARSVNAFLPVSP